MYNVNLYSITWYILHSLAVAVSYFYLFFDMLASVFLMPSINFSFFLATLPALLKNMKVTIKSSLISICSYAANTLGCLYVTFIYRPAGLYMAWISNYSTGSVVHTLFGGWIHEIGHLGPGLCSSMHVCKGWRYLFGHFIFFFATLPKYPSAIQMHYAYAAWSKSLQPWNRPLDWTCWTHKKWCNQWWKETNKS